MRSIWSGSISFSLVNIPIKLYSATAGEHINFDLLHAKDLSPIRYAKVCKKDGEEVDYQEVVKGFEYEPGSYVVIDKEDFAKANARKTSTIDILGFVDDDEIDSIYYEKPYYLGPGKGGEKAYTVFRAALTEAKKVALGRYVLRNKEKLAVVKPEENILVLNQMRYHDDVRDWRELEPAEMDVSKDELELAIKLIEQLSRTFNPNDYSDSYKQELMQIIQDKVAGRVPATRGEIPKPTEVKDLMAVLRESLEQVQH